MNRSIIDVNGAQLEVCRVHPEGRTNKLPILLFHEGLGSIDLWKKFPEKLARVTNREVIVWSREGHGYSASTSKNHSLTYMHDEARLIVDVHDALGLDSAHWFGHSDGGSIALIAASYFPELAASLILEAPHVFVEELTVASIAQISDAFGSSDMAERMKRYHADPAMMFKRWRDIWLDPLFKFWSIEDLLVGIKQPVLLIQGLDDQYGSLDQLDRIEKALGATVRIELERCGHSPHHEQTDIVLASVANFLERQN